MKARAALPVTLLARSRPRGACLGGGGGAVYVGFPEGVVAVTSAAIPSMPNGIVVHPRELPPVQPHEAATLSPGRLRVGRTTIGWDDDDPYDLVLARPRRAWDGLPPIAPSPDPLLARGTNELAHALIHRDRDGIARAALGIVGRGRGLTPEGDDVVAGAVSSARALGIPEHVLVSALPQDLDSRTSSLSATLLRLAVGGRVVEPLLRLLSQDGGSVEFAARQLVRVGSSTGNCYLRALVAVIDAHRNHVIDEDRPEREEVA